MQTRSRTKLSHAQHSDSGKFVGLNSSSALDAFPELWTEILKNVPEADRLKHVLLVSRVLSEACRDPSLWPELRVLQTAFQTEAHWRSFLRWLAVRASGLQAFPFNLGFRTTEAATVWRWRTPELIALLAASAPQLRSLEHWYPQTAPPTPASALPAGLGRLSQLSSLTLDCGSAPVTTAQVDAMVQTLPVLQRLSLECIHERALSDGFPVSIATSCRQLQSVAIYCSGVEDLPPGLGLLTALTELRLSFASVERLPDAVLRLSALRHLEICSEEPGALPLGVCHLPMLTQLQLTYARLTHLPDSISLLTALQCLDFSVQELEAFPPGLWRLAALTRLELAEEFDVDLPDSISRLTALRELDISGWITPRLPPGLTACQLLTSLWMGHDDLSPVLASLQSLRSLIVWADEGQEATYWTQLTALTELRLDCRGDEERSIHPGLAGMASLRRLEINTDSGGVGQLPAGPYLSGLESLSMESCIEVPSELVAATQLRHLHMGGRSDSVELTAADIAVLSSLPALKTLHVRKRHSMDQAVWDERVAQLQAEIEAGGRAAPALI